MSCQGKRSWLYKATDLSSAVVVAAYSVEVVDSFNRFRLYRNIFNKYILATTFTLTKFSLSTLPTLFLDEICIYLNILSKRKYWSSAN